MANCSLKIICTSVYIFDQEVIAWNNTIQFDRQIEYLVHTPSQTTINSPSTLMTLQSTTLHTQMTQEIMKIIDPNDTQTPSSVIQVISEATRDRPVTYRETNHEAQIYSKATHAWALSSYAHKLMNTSEIASDAEFMNIHILIHPYATCHVIHVAP